MSPAAARMAAAPKRAVQRVQVVDYHVLLNRAAALVARRPDVDGVGVTTTLVQLATSAA